MGTGSDADPVVDTGRVLRSVSAQVGGRSVPQVRRRCVLVQVSGCCIPELVNHWALHFWASQWTGVVVLYEEEGTVALDKSVGAVFLCKSHWAHILARDRGAVFPCESVGTASLCKSVGTVRQCKLVGVASQCKLGTSSEHESVGTASLNKSVCAASLDFQGLETVLDVDLTQSASGVNPHSAEAFACVPAICLSTSSTNKSQTSNSPGPDEKAVHVACFIVRT